MPHIDHIAMEFGESFAKTLYVHSKHEAVRSLDTCHDWNSTIPDLPLERKYDFVLSPQSHKGHDAGQFDFVYLVQAHERRSFFSVARAEFQGKQWASVRMLTETLLDIKDLMPPGNTAHALHFNVHGSVDY